MRSTIALCTLLGFTAIAAAAEPLSPFFDRPLHVGAHRGGANLWPENTVFAYQECAKLSPDVLLEADVYTTADGHLVVLHDNRVDRTTNGEGDITELDFETVRALDAGYDFTLDNGATFPHRGKELQIPTLAEALAAAPNHRFLIETKGGEGVVAKTLEAIRDAGAEERVLLASFKPEHMTELRESAPDIPRCYDFSNGMRLLAAVRGDKWDAYEPEAQCLSLMKRMVDQFKLTPEDVARMTEKGIVAQIHTINRREEMDRMLAFGFTSILSDDPAELQEAVDAYLSRKTAQE